ncbi:MAG: rhomboid family intramembrane serine protease [Flavobacteriales bacterium]|nr:rhomboid family intramembrane serine protease [Flavobacteriales bacterium]
MPKAYGYTPGPSVKQRVKRFVLFSPVALLAFINILVFFIIHITSAASPATAARIVDVLALPLGRLSIFQQPWSLVTHIFVHTDFFHVLFDLLGLTIFGFWLSQTAGRIILVPLYLLGGLFGGLLTLAVAHIPGVEQIFHQSHLAGGTAAVMAIVLASTLFMPDHIVHLYFLFPVRMKYLGLGMVALDVISLLFLSQPAGHISHLGGALVGVLFIRSIPRRERRRLVSLSDLLKASSVKDFDRIMAGKKALKDEEYNHLRVSREEQLDAILDKIRRDGLQSLNAAEKKFLDEYSRQA